MKYSTNYLTVKKWRKLHPDKLKEQSARHHLKHRDEDLARSRKRRARLRLTCLVHYSGGKMECACCGIKETMFLSIDHIAGGGDKHRRSLFGKWRGAMYHWLIENNFPTGYRVLCFNCNCARGFFGYCPHEREKSG